MKINYIKYHNYRCFEDVEVRFDTTSDKNISLVMGVIGSGKTEMLFSFQWVLYGFDLKSMREKEETPYALNSNLYHKLENDKHAPSEDCWVELGFTYKGTEFFMKRTQRYMRKGDKIDFTESVSLSYTEENGERSIPEKDKEIVERKLSRIIPKTILEGITFDGERMKKLNDSDDQTKATIKNVISLVTNEELFELCSGEIKHAKEDVTREKKRIERANGDSTSEELEKEIESLEEAIEDYEIKQYGINNNLEKIEGELNKISAELSQLEDARKQEEKRKGLEKDLEKAKKNYNQQLDFFFKRLVDGYTLVTDQLVDDVKESLENVDVPTGLTTEAVNSIMKRPTCICGCDMTADVITRLKHMLATLPPDNISSTLFYMANQFGDEKRKNKELLKDTYRVMHDCDNDIIDIKKELSEISTMLIGNVSEKVSSLENKRNELLQKKGRLMQDDERCTYEINRDKKRLKEAQKELEETSGNSGRIRELAEQQRVLDMFKDAIKNIEEKNRELSLVSINDYLSKAFATLSEDVGRCIYLCQYDKREKYRLVTYSKKEFDAKRTAWAVSGKLITLQQDGFTPSEIEENIILDVLAGKSTGQSKTNSLAFAKAILDYSNEDRSDDKLKTSHDYPFLIDSPFTEISGNNLINIANNIHSFAGQIILMADDNSYSGVRHLVEKNVNSSTYLSKDKEKGITYIKK